MPLSARGRTEASPEGLPVYLVFGTRAEPDPLFVERFDLPLSAAAYAWTAFSAETGEVTLKESGGLRILSRRMTSKEAAGELMVYGYVLGAYGYDAAPGTPREILTVRFDYARRPGEGLIVQPARRALLEGIRAAGSSTGFVRLEEISHLGAGRFRARVALR